MSTFLVIYFMIGLLWAIIISVSVNPKTLMDFFMYAVWNILLWPLTLILAFATIYRRW